MVVKHFVVVEVDARGYCANSLVNTAQKLGFSSKQVKALTKECSLVALETSFAIWLARNTSQWDICLLFCRNLA